MTAKKTAVRAQPKEAAPVAVPERRQEEPSKYVQEIRRQREPKGDETPLEYARRVSGWPPLKRQEAR